MLINYGSANLAASFHGITRFVSLPGIGLLFARRSQQAW
jgi:hypothetical protein